MSQISFRRNKNVNEGNSHPSFYGMVAVGRTHYNDTLFALVRMSYLFFWVSDMTEGFTYSGQSMEHT